MTAASAQIASTWRPHKIVIDNSRTKFATCNGCAIKTMSHTRTSDTRVALSVATPPLGDVRYLFQAGSIPLGCDMLRLISETGEKRIDRILHEMLISCVDTS